MSFVFVVSLFKIKKRIKVDKVLKENGLYANKYDRKYWRYLYGRDIK